MIKRVWRISELQICQIIVPISISKNGMSRNLSVSAQFIRQHATRTPRNDGNRTPFPDILALFADKWSYNPAETVLQKNLREKVSKLKDEILGQNDDAEKIEKILEDSGVALFRMYPDGSAVVELLTQLKSFPYLAMEVLSWRRKQLDHGASITVEEYVKGIVMAGRMKNVDLAVELFREASNKNLKSTSLFNALMSAYSYNSLVKECQSLFWDLKMDTICKPSIITYNILITAFGRSTLVDHMEGIYREVKDLNLTPTANTYKGLIAGYITAWMWDEMEKTYRLMKAGPFKPDVDIHLLMLRGYAIAGKLDKMEEIYELVRDHVDYKEIPLIRTMIRAYSKSSNVARIERIEELLKFIPENEYRPWLNVSLICMYAKEDLLEHMENSINQAFERDAYVTKVRVMKCIISSYFRQNAVDKLAEFLQRANFAGWKMCRSVYHCKMVMYSSQMRLSEMERVLYEMDKLNMGFSKKTFWILYKSYKRWGHRSKLEQVIGMMCKHGYQIPFDACNL